MLALWVAVFHCADVCVPRARVQALAQACDSVTATLLPVIAAALPVATAAIATLPPVSLTDRLADATEPLSSPAQQPDPQAAVFESLCT